MIEKEFNHRPTQVELTDMLLTAKSNNTKILTRPRINWRKICVVGLFFLAIFAIETILVCIYVEGLVYKIVIPVFTILLMLVIHIKPLTILCIRMYQRFAPMTIRCRCRFNPTCSEYMILSIQKYGYWKGIKKGVNRLIRCKYPNGGIDFP